MKKLTAAALALLLLMAFPIAALADGTTTLTTTVADASYTLNIPANQTIEYGATNTNIGNVTVTDSSGFAVGKDLQVTVTYEPFKSKTANTTIPFNFVIYSESRVDYVVNSGSKITFSGKTDGSVNMKAIPYDNPATGVGVQITSEDWGKADNGTYTAIITFTSQIVSE